MLSLFLNWDPESGPGPGGSPHRGVLSPRLGLCFHPDWHLLTETWPSVHLSSSPVLWAVQASQCTHWTSSEISRGYNNTTQHRTQHNNLVFREKVSIGDRSGTGVWRKHSLSERWNCWIVRKTVRKIAIGNQRRRTVFLLQNLFQVII